MDPTRKVNPVFVLNLRKTLSKCGRNQGVQQAGLLDTEPPIHGETVSEIPVDPKKNREVLDKYRERFNMPKAATDEQIISEIANRRIAECEKKESRLPSLYGLSKGLALDTYRPAESELIHIRITRK